MKVPCYNCPNRKVHINGDEVIGCHSYCQKYNQYKIELELRKQVINKVRLPMMEVNDYVILRARRAKKNRNIKRG